MVTAIMPLPQLSPIAAAIKALYGVASDLNKFVDDHIARLKRSRNPTVARTGRVLEAAKYGFGVTYISSVTIIAAGQLLLGNPLAAISTAASAATLANPLVMTAAALGAVVYGYGALTDDEREELHTNLSNGLELGIELVKAIIRFAVEKTKVLLSQDNLKEMKSFIAEKAKVFGRTLSDVTRTLKDRTDEAFLAIKEGAKKGKEVLEDGGRALTETVEDGVDIIVDTTRRIRKRTADIDAVRGLSATAVTAVPVGGASHSRSASVRATRSSSKPKGSKANSRKS